jgi:hypothetical protein
LEEVLAGVVEVLAEVGEVLAGIIRGSCRGWNRFLQGLEEVLTWVGRGSGGGLE